VSEAERQKETEMKELIRDSEAMIEKINGLNSWLGARLWTAKDEGGNVSKVRVYFEHAKGYIEPLSSQKASFKTVARVAYTETLTALKALGYDTISY
jgi:hypothetical protein